MILLIIAIAFGIVLYVTNYKAAFIGRKSVVPKSVDAFTTFNMLVLMAFLCAIMGKGLVGFIIVLIPIWLRVMSGIWVKNKMFILQYVLWGGIILFTLFIVWAILDMDSFEISGFRSWLIAWVVMFVLYARGIYLLHFNHINSKFWPKVTEARFRLLCIAVYLSVLSSFALSTV